MKLQTKLHLMVSLIITAVVVGIFFVISIYSKDSMEKQMQIATSDMAYAVAQSESVAYHLKNKNQNDEIQNILLPLMKNTHYHYIIVFDMDAIQYSYPYRSGLYKLYKNGGEESVLTEGKSYTSADTNELISAIRAFEPIYYDGEQVGAVLVGLLTDTIQKENQRILQRTHYTFVLGLILGVVVAYFLAVNIKKSIFNLEPKEIALLLTQRDMIFNHLQFGILAVDNEGKIILNNAKADDILCIEGPIKGLSLKLFSKCIYEEFISVQKNKEDLMNLTTVMNNGTKVMVNICNLYDHTDEVIGAAISIEELTMVQRLAEELTGSKNLVESLRAQNHEFMNKLQVLSGLIQLEKYDTAIDFIDEQSHKNINLSIVIGDQIDDDLIAGLILSKYEIITEKKIDFVIDKESSVSGLPKNVRADEICTIIANLLDNSMEAVMESDYKHIYLKILSDTNMLKIEVRNSGPQIESDEILMKGFSTKGDNRGYGLSNSITIVNNFGGNLYYENNEEVTWYVEK